MYFDGFDVSSVIILELDEVQVQVDLVVGHRIDAQVLRL